MQSPKSIESLSEYELRRIQNIQENKSFLRRLFDTKISRFFYIMGNGRNGTGIHMSPSQIETHSIRIRAWLIQMIVKGLPEGMSWIQSLRVHIRGNIEVDKWFHRENIAEIWNPLTLEAISTLFPDQYFADVLVSHFPADRILKILRRKIQQSN